jgi:hypothetical protein
MISVLASHPKRRKPYDRNDFRGGKSFTVFAYAIAIGSHVTMKWNCKAVVVTNEWSALNPTLSILMFLLKGPNPEI